MKKAFLISGEKILLAGLFITPFTSLRFGFIGPGEVLILVAAIIAVLTNGMSLRFDKRLRIFYRFWTTFLIITLLGLYFNNFFAYTRSGTTKSMVFDLFSYIFILLTVIVVGHYSANRPDFPVTFFRKLFIYWGIFFVILFAMSFFTRSIFGMPLLYHEYFSPLVKNVHQAAMITCTMGFILLYLGLKSSQLYVKVFFFIGAILFAVMAIKSGSTKAMLGIVVGILISLVHVVGYRTSGRGRYLINISTLFISIAFILVFLFMYSDELIFLAIEFFTENDGRSSRETIYKQGFASGLNSPLVGYGPGSHVPYRQTFWDAHNTTLTIFLQSGLIGILLFVWFNIRLLTKLSINFALFGAITAIGMYIIGGDILRRLPIWIILMGLYYFAIYNPWKPRKLSQINN